MNIREQILLMDDDTLVSLIKEIAFIYASDYPTTVQASETLSQLRNVHKVYADYHLIYFALKDEIINRLLLDTFRK